MNLILMATALLTVLILLSGTHALGTLIKGHRMAAGMIWTGCVCSILGLITLHAPEVDLGDSRTGAAFVAAGISMMLTLIGTALEEWMER